MEQVQGKGICLGFLLRRIGTAAGFELFHSRRFAVVSQP